MKDRKEIESELHPDPNELDREWVNQPRLRFRYGARLAEARKLLSEAKADMELTTAELELTIRSDPSKFGLDKVTEAAIKATVLQQDEYTNAKKVTIQAQHDVDVLDAAVSAVDHRKKALEDLVALFLAGYFAKPRAPEGAKEKMEEVEKQYVRRRGRD
ncbi:hypothetical protein M0R72_14700 [Candidatus Pacearchaeota archaeon]|jgi:hypothetical protein|nr:hypothetical protein [Candidatus Pacearchaeota archaeon]